jgi:hypothetical protein
VKKKAKKKSKPKAKKSKLKVKAKKRAPAKAKAKKKAAAKSKAKKSAKKGGKSKLSIIPPANSVLLGRVEDYYAHIGVIAFVLQKPIRLGDHLHVLGHTTNLEFTLDSMQINHQSVQEAGPKDAVGIKITSRARRGDYVFLIRG